jgi:hypothetical protein
MFKKMDKSAMCPELIAVSTELLSLLQSCQNNIPARTMKARNVFLEPAGQ